MGIQIKRTGDGGDTTTPSLWTVLTTKLLARMWVGKIAPQLSQLSLQPGENTLLYFRTRGCTVCDLIDMKVAAACQQAGVTMVIVDRYAKSEAPEDKEIYSQPGNILDFGGAINSAFQVGVYPSLVLIDNTGHIVLKEVGGGHTPPERFDEYLRDCFGKVLAV
jgi:hypothetical protein